MAKTAFRAKLQNGAPYTVPAGKYAIFSAVTMIGTHELSIGGVGVAAMGPPNSGNQVPIVTGLTANAGEVISRGSGGSGGDCLGIFGFLYDV